ncbi:type II secretion system F family protein [Candidatus Poriferisodalis sp.]|uniref:type II secretion system F family protein n=1 Tax=Candidatus Poriferisodalis sp. TaxID=3101277 RepID=UPI003AF4E2A9
MHWPLGFALTFSVGFAAVVAAIAGLVPRRRTEAAAVLAVGAASALPRRQRGLSGQAAVQAIAVVGGTAVGYAATGLWGMAALLGGLGALLPPFVMAPRRRRRQTREALAWQLWTRQLAELTRSGAGLTDSLRGSTEHAPSEIAHIVGRVASTAELHGIDAALDELAAAGDVWEPEVAVGLRMAAASGGALTEPLLGLCNRMGDVVSLHRARTEAVVQLWTQTIALLGLAGGVVTLMYRNNASYFAPYRTPTGQLVLTMIAFVLLGATGFLVYHSVVRVDPSVLAPLRRRRGAKEPL